MTLILTWLAISITSAVRLFFISTTHVGSGSISLINLPYPLFTRLLLVNWTTATVLYGLPTIHINKLQRVQNAAARLVTNTPRICHITPIWEDLHWLPIKYRIEFKIVLLTFKCLYGLAPQYLVDLTAVATQSRYNLRSGNATLLVPAKARCLPTLGDRAFQSAAPKLWNSVQAEITSFNRALKTFFFLSQLFNCHT